MQREGARCGNDRGSGPLSLFDLQPIRHHLIFPDQPSLMLSPSGPWQLTFRFLHSGWPFYLVNGLRALFSFKPETSSATSDPPCDMHGTNDGACRRDLQLTEMVIAASSLRSEMPHRLWTLLLLFFFCHYSAVIVDLTLLSAFKMIIRPLVLGGASDNRWRFDLGVCVPGVPDGGLLSAWMISQAQETV